MNKLIKTIYVLAAIIIFSAPSCTKLDETIYDKVLTSDFYKTQDEIIAALVPAYGDLRTLIDLRGTHSLGEFSTDEVILPTRGRHWYDGGNFQRFSEHTWTSEVAYLNNGWNAQFQLVNRSNMLIYQFSKLDNMDATLKESFTAELKCLRALGYFYLLDNFGNVPIVDRFDVPAGYLPANNVDFTTGRKEVFNFVESDLISNVDKVSADNNSSTYGRMNKWAAYALLTKLYINAQVWTGTAKWDEAITYADKIIGSGNFILEPNYFANFVSQNQNSKENIFAVPYDEYRTGNGWGSYNTTIWYLVGQHFTGNKIFGVPASGTSGSCALPSHYRSYDPKDIRLKGWMIGQQYNKATGQQILCTEESAPLPLEYTIDFINRVNPNDGIVYDHKNALEYMGARFAKYEINYQGNGMPNDYAMFRLADILLLKAEALMRKNNGVATQTAVDLVNQVRQRAFAPADYVPLTTGTLTLDQLLKERSWELYFEGWRRQDLVRWGKFVRGTWEFFDRSGESDTRNVYPIPQPQMNSNTNLKQNPGY